MCVEKKRWKRAASVSPQMSQSSTLYSFSESWAPKGAQLSAVQLHPSPSIESIPVTRRGMRPATAAAAREAARRVGQWRDQQRQKRIEEEEEQGQPWFRERGVSASKLRINAWRAEALEMPTPPRSLIGLAMPPGGLGASGAALHFSTRSTRRRRARAAETARPRDRALPRRSAS